MNNTDYNKYLAPCCTIAREAGSLIMGYFQGAFATRSKDDKSPVTDADVAANTHIIRALSQLTPHIPVIGEEDEILPASQQGMFWLVDPLDGTRSFVRGEPEFTVNIGLIRDHAPILGVIYAPPQNLLYYASLGHGVWREKTIGQPETISTRKPSPEGLVVVRSKSHPSKATEAFLQSIRIKEMISGSSSIKLCMLAEGSADIYPRFGRTMEWDTAAGHAILNEAGGRIETETGDLLIYGKDGFENPGFIAYGK